MAKERPLAPDVRGNYFLVDSRRLVEDDGFNRRENYGDIQALANGIKAAGLDTLDPLWCYKKGESYVVVKGHRRRRALKILEKDGEILKVRILLLPKGFSIEEMIMDQATGNEGLPFSPWEKAKVVRDLRAKGWSHQDIVERSHWSIVYVRKLLSLADAPQKLINLVRSGRVSGTLAMDVIAEGKTEELIAAAEKTPLKNQDDIGDLFSQQGGAAPPSPRITKSDVQRPNSVKIFKKWIPAIKEEKLEKLPPQKKEILHWLQRMVAGEVTADELNDFFC